MADDIRDIAYELRKIRKILERIADAVAGPSEPSSGGPAAPRGQALPRMAEDPEPNIRDVQF